MRDHSFSVLILCTGNSARSVMAEALFTVLGKGRFVAYSAGSHPNGKVNPFAVERCATLGYDTSKLRSKSWNEFATPVAPLMDFVITVCDAAAGEVCPKWRGTPMTAHWGFEDPAVFEGTDDEKREVFDRVFRQILNRVTVFVNLPLHVMDKNSIQQEMRVIGENGSGANFSGERKTMYSPVPQRAERTALQTAGAVVSLRRKFVRSN